MKLQAIVAMSQNQVIGINNQLPWNMPADLQHFKKLTLNHAIIMGRKTFESIGRPLPKRDNYILTRNKNYTAKECYVINELSQCPAKEAFLIGGEQLFTTYLDQVDTLYLTIIHHDFEGDTFFKFDKTQWIEKSVEHHKADADNAYDYSFFELKNT